MSNNVPILIKIGFTAFMAVLVPVYLRYYGPTNFLYFCDMALLFTLFGVWFESPLLVSMPAVGIFVPQMLWLIDFGLNLGGFSLTGMTNYMFNGTTPILLRLLSLFHGWLPLLLIYLVAKLGYDRRALVSWTTVTWTLMLVSYFFLPGPRPDAGLMPVNINYVFGPSDAAPQTWMPSWAWLLMMMLVLPLGMFVPTHFALQHWRGRDPLARSRLRGFQNDLTS